MASRVHLVSLNFKFSLTFINLISSLAVNPSLTVKCQHTVFPPTYSVLRKDRNRNGGGVFVAIKSEFVCEEKPTFGRDCEIIWSKFKTGNCKTLHLASYYRPPNSPHDALEQLNCVFESSEHHPNIIVAGDFNLGDINWSAEVPFAINTIGCFK